jgi:hypothetical protein
MRSSFTLVVDFLAFWNLESLCWAFWAELKIVGVSRCCLRPPTINNFWLRLCFSCGTSSDIVEVYLRTFYLLLIWTWLLSLSLVCIYFDLSCLSPINLSSFYFILSCVDVSSYDDIFSCSLSIRPLFRNSRSFCCFYSNSKSYFIFTCSSRFFFAKIGTEGVS